MNDYFVRYIELPYHINACTVPNTDGTFDVYVNLNLDKYCQIAALKHEIEHIKKDHFYNDIKPIEVVEKEAG